MIRSFTFLTFFLTFLFFFYLFTISAVVSQFRESGCENCQFFKMEEDHERVVECTTPNFNGLVGSDCFSSKFLHLLFFFKFSVLILIFFFHLIMQQDHFCYGSLSQLGCPMVAHWYVHSSLVAMITIFPCLTFQFSISLD